MRRVVLIIILCLILISSMTACWDSHEVDQWAYVYSIGVDKGVVDKIRFTVQIPTLKGQSKVSGEVVGMGGSEEQGKGGNFTVISVDCPTLYAGVDMINTSISRTLNYMHTKYIMVSEDFAKEGVEPFVNGMRRARQIRRIMHFMVVRGEAREFIENLNPVLEVALSKMQESMMEQEDQIGLFNNITYSDFLNDMKSTKGMPSCVLADINDFSSYLPTGTKSKETKASGDYYAGEIPRSGGNKFEFLGTAVFNGDKMVGEINGDETRVMLMAKNDFVRSTMTVPDPLEPKMYVTVDIKMQKRSNVKVTFLQGKPIIHLKVSLEGDLINLQSDINYESEKLKPILENSFKTYIKAKLDKTIDKCKGLSCDVFGFGDKASMQFLTIQEWEKYNWNKQFKNAEVTTEVEFVIRRTGTVVRTNPTLTSEEQK